MHPRSIWVHLTTGAGPNDSRKLRVLGPGVPALRRDRTRHLLCETPSSNWQYQSFRGLLLGCAVQFCAPVRITGNSVARSQTRCEVFARWSRPLASQCYPPVCCQLLLGSRRRLVRYDPRLRHCRWRRRCRYASTSRLFRSALRHGVSAKYRKQCSAAAVSSAAPDVPHTACLHAPSVTQSAVTRTRRHRTQR